MKKRKKKNRFHKILKIIPLNLLKIREFFVTYPCSFKIFILALQKLKYYILSPLKSKVYIRCYSQK